MHALPSNVTHFRPKGRLAVRENLRRERIATETRERQDRLDRWAVIRAGIAREEEIAPRPTSAVRYIIAVWALVIVALVCLLAVR